MSLKSRFERLGCSEGARSEEPWESLVSMKPSHVLQSSGASVLVRPLFKKAKHFFLLMGDISNQLLYDEKIGYNRGIWAEGYFPLTASINLYST